MAKLVSYTVNIFSNATNTNLGVKKIITLQSENPEGDMRYWDAIDAHDQCPPFPTASKILSGGKFILIAPPGNGKSPIYPLRPSLDEVCETEHSIILKVPSNYTAGTTIWTVTFPGVVNNSEIHISYSGNSIVFEFFKAGVSLGAYSPAPTYYNFDDQWGFYRGLAGYGGFPCIDSSGEHVGCPHYGAFVAYVHSQTFVDPPEIMRCEVGIGYISHVTADTWNNFFGTADPIRPVDTDNPYDAGGTSYPSDDDANFSEDSDEVTVDNLPSIDAVGTGFATLFTPNKTQLAALADIMWDTSIFGALQNLVENISNMFTSLAIVPFTVTAGATVSVNFLGLFDTGVSLTLASAQFYEFDMGSINLGNDSRIFTSGSALDYSPFSRLGIFLPFIGFEELDIDECRGATINLKYRIDILSGSCVALISVSGNTIYQFTGNCLSQIPITSESMQSLVTDAVNVGIATTEASSAKGAVGVAETALNEAEKAGSGVRSAKSNLKTAESHFNQTKSSLASSTANAAMGMKPTFAKNGSVSAAASLLSVRQPYLFLRTPRQSMPARYQRYNGFPCNMTGLLSSFSGYTVVESIRLNDLVATTPEVEEIYSLLHSGVII